MRQGERPCLALKVIEPKPEHVFAWVELVYKFLAEGIEDYDWGVNELHLHETYHKWDKKNFGFLLVDGDRVVGVLAGSIGNHFFNYDNKFFNESMWYVIPEYRSKGGGILLYRACLKRCKELGITRLVFGHTSQMKEEFSKIYKRLGFTYLESHYEKVL